MYGSPPLLPKGDNSTKDINVQVSYKVAKWLEA